MKKIQNEFDLDYFKKKVDGAYFELTDLLEVKKDHESYLINNEKIIKAKLYQLASIGYERYKNNFVVHQFNIQKNSEPVLQFNLAGEYVNWFPSIRNAEKEMSKTHGTISSAIKRNGKSCKSYWILEKDYKK